MKLSKRIGLGVLLAAALLVAVVLVPSMGASPNAGQTKSEKALEYISQKHGVPKEKLMITNEKEANFPLTNRKILSVNILDPQSKEFYYVDLDEAGNIADMKAVKELEYAKYSEKYGKKEIALYEKLQKMNPDDTVEVGIWLSPIEFAPKPSLPTISSSHVPQISVVSPTISTQKSERGISKEEYKEILDAKRKACEQKEKPVLDILKAKNINIRYASQYAPVIYAEVPVKSMAEVENIPDIEGIYLAIEEFKPLLNNVASTVRAEPVWDAGITGSGIQVAVVEEGAIDFANQPYLLFGSTFNPGPGIMISNHATEVAGIVASQHPDYKGIAHGAPALLSADFYQWNYTGEPAESRAIRASDWAIQNYADILTNSYSNDTRGVLSGIDKYFDNVIWNYWRTVTVAAGNNYPGENWRVTSPGLGFNVITVGGFEDKGNTSWSGDEMWANSAYVDPVSRNGDREKPEVAAVATHISDSSRIVTTKGGGAISQTYSAGTSYAAPAVAGEAALLMQADYNLTVWPEMVKAIIMSSADHNIEGASKLSEKDGVGGIDISKILDTGAVGLVTNSSNYPIDFGFDVSAGQKIRVVIVWDSHPDNNRPPQIDDLKSDLNLVVYGPSGAMVDKSDSYDNSYEIAEFNATAAGTYHAVVYAKTFSDPYEYLGFAVTYV